MKIPIWKAGALVAAASLCVTLAFPASAQRGRNDRSDRYGNNRQSMESIRRLVDRAEQTSNRFREVFEHYEWDRYDDRYGRDGYYRDNRDSYNRDRDYRYRRDDRTDPYYRDRYDRTDPNYRDRYDRTDPYYRDRYDRNDPYYRDDRSRTDPYYRDDRYRRDDRYNGSSHAYLKEVVQRMDEGLERLNRETDNRDYYNSSRTTAAEVLRNARIVNNAFNARRIGTGSMQSLWSRLRADLNQLASIYGLQRV
jgi:hypothetical protein